ncbi:hypothetical protein [Halochromatium roseum]|uniref:hypothetical protein n=1 Tax=Halochromatium roseum TaxID=391920 RepID=UPI0019135365|nr:hypothetical protein [Halochromatium roseum]MBK5937871.1 hypothetical protein [Halochromatium roseum]
MRNLALTLARNLEIVERERGPFKVKCLVCKEPDDLFWDLILWADWFESNERARLSYLLDKLIKPLDPEALMYFSAMMTYGANDDSPFLRSLLTIQRNFDQGLYATSWHDEIVQIRSTMPRATLIVPLGHRLIEATEAASEAKMTAAAAR